MHSKEAEGVGGVFVVKTVAIGIQNFRDLIEKKCFYVDKTDIAYFKRVSESMDDSDASLALYQLSAFLYRYYGKKAIILLDEYDTPMQEAYVDGYWDKMVGFMRNLFNSNFKTNPYVERAVMTGITRVSKESIFSDLNNLKVVTTTSDAYTTAFGFTEQEVFDALDQYGYDERKADVKEWYDGFIFGEHKDIYNPWSILNFLDTGELATYWANTSSNSLVGKLVRESDEEIKVHDAEEEKTLADTVASAHQQIKEKQYEALLLAKGFTEENIRTYGFAFEGKKVLIG